MQGAGEKLSLCNRKINLSRLTFLYGSFLKDKSPESDGHKGMIVTRRRESYGKVNLKTEKIFEHQCSGSGGYRIPHQPETSLQPNRIMGKSKRRKIRQQPKKPEKIGEKMVKAQSSMEIF